MVLNNINKNDSILLEVFASVFTLSSNFTDNPRIFFSGFGVKPRVFWMYMVPRLYLSYIYFSGFGWNVEFSERVWYHAYFYHIFSFQGSGETSSFLNVYGTTLIFIIYLLFRVRVKRRVFWMCMVPRLFLSYIFFSGFGWNVEFSERVWYHAYFYHYFSGFGWNVEFSECVWYHAYFYHYFSGFGWNVEFSERVWYHAYFYHIFSFQGSGETSSFLNVYGTTLIFIIYLLFRVRVKRRVFWMCMVPRLFLSYIFFSGFGWNVEFSERVWYHAYFYHYFSGFGWNVEFSECVWYQAYIYHIFSFQGSGETSSFLNVYGTTLIFIIYLLFRGRVKPRVFWTCTCMVPSLYLSYVYFSGFGWNLEFSEHVWYQAYIYHMFTFQGSGETSSFLNVYGTTLIFSLINILVPMCISKVCC